MFVRRDGTELEQLSRYRDARHPLWSPDGRHIAYIHGTKDGEDLWIVDADGSDDRLLVDGPIVTPGGFDWLPGLQGIIFSKHDDSYQDTDLYLVGVAGGEPELLLEDLEPVQIDVSPNGRKVAFWSPTTHLRGPKYDLFTVSSDGSRLSELTDNPARTQVSDPVWSPDSRSVAFVSTFDPRLEGNRRYASQIFIADAAKGSIRMLSRRTTTLKSYPSWSPDGASVAYLHRCDNDYCTGRQDIEITDARTSNPLHRLTTPALMEEGPLEWSRDGERLLFGAWEGTTSSEADLYSWDVATETARNLTGGLGVYVAVGSWDW